MGCPADDPLRREPQLQADRRTDRPSDGLPRRLLTRNILYTGITRAKQLLVIVGSTETVSHMVANNQKGRRYSALKARLRGERAADAPEIALL